MMMMKRLITGGLECWRQRSVRYADHYKRNYFDVLTELHEHLGLTVRLGNAVAMASLVGITYFTLSSCLYPSHRLLKHKFHYADFATKSTT